MNLIPIRRVDPSAMNRVVNTLQSAIFSDGMYRNYVKDELTDKNYKKQALKCLLFVISMRVQQHISFIEVTYIAFIYSRTNTVISTKN